MKNPRRVIGTILLTLPLLAVLALLLLGVFMASLGMDIHLTSRKAAYIVDACLILGLAACVFLGVHLRRNPDG